ncbi:unnamed protein product, partial [Linum tenue]
MVIWEAIISNRGTQHRLPFADPLTHCLLVFRYDPILLFGYILGFPCIAMARLADLAVDDDRNKKERLISRRRRRSGLRWTTRRYTPTLYTQGGNLRNRKRCWNGQIYHIQNYDVRDDDTSTRGRGKMVYEGSPNPTTRSYLVSSISGDLLITGWVVVAGERTDGDAGSDVGFRTGSVVGFRTWSDIGYRTGSALPGRTWSTPASDRCIAYYSGVG